MRLWHSLNPEGRTKCTAVRRARFGVYLDLARAGSTSRTFVWIGQMTSAHFCCLPLVFHLLEVSQRLFSFSHSIDTVLSNLVKPRKYSKHQHLSKENRELGPLLQAITWMQTLRVRGYLSLMISLPQRLCPRIHAAIPSSAFITTEI